MKSPDQSTYYCVICQETVTVHQFMEEHGAHHDADVPNDGAYMAHDVWVSWMRRIGEFWDVYEP